MNRNNIKRIAAMVCAALVAFAFVISIVILFVIVNGLLLPEISRNLLLFLSLIV